MSSRDHFKIGDRVRIRYLPGLGGAGEKGTVESGGMSPDYLCIVLDDDNGAGFFHYAELVHLSPLEEMAEL